MQKEHPQPPDAEPDQLARDLTEVINHIRLHLPAHALSHDKLALVHLLEGMSIEQWAEYVSIHKLQDWYAIPCAPDLAATLASLIEFQNTLALQRNIDPLTGIGNRGFFDQHLAKEIERAKRSKEDLSLLIFDLDNFKAVNDTYGHACGDMVLQRFAELLRVSTRPYDYVARIGGEEFAVILPNTAPWTGIVQGNRLLEEFRRIVFTWDEQQFSMTFSGGVASYSMLENEISPMTLFQSADTALYRAKHKGKNLITLMESKKIAQDRHSLVRVDEKRFLFSNDLPE